MEEVKVFKLKKNSIGKAKNPKVFHYLLKISRDEEQLRCDIIDKLDNNIVETFLIENNKEALINFDKWFKEAYLKYYCADVTIFMNRGTYKLYSHLKTKHNYIVVE